MWISACWGEKEAMVRSRQTAKRSTGGRSDRRELNIRPVRKAAPAMKRAAH